MGGRHVDQGEQGINMPWSEQLSAAGEFVATWRELLGDLDAYKCSLTCGEAAAAVRLLQAYGDHATADALLKAHIEHDEPDEREAHGLTAAGAS